MDCELVTISPRHFAEFLENRDVRNSLMLMNSSLSLEIVDEYPKQWGEPDPGIQTTIEVVVRDCESGESLDGCVLFIPFEAGGIARVAQSSKWGPMPVHIFPLPRWIDALRSGNNALLITNRLAAHLRGK